MEVFAALYSNIQVHFYIEEGLGLVPETNAIVHVTVALLSKSQDGEHHS
jgi:hypothetical protein